jgi:hypothetical protein
MTMQTNHQDQSLANNATMQTVLLIVALAAVMLIAWYFVF